MKTRIEIELQEKKTHGSILFPFNIYPCTIPKDFPAVPIHWQKSGEIIYIKKGRGYVQIDREWAMVEAGTICFVPPGTLHALKEMPGHSMEYENIIFDVDFLGKGSADICAQEYLVPFAAGKLISPLILWDGKKGHEEMVAYLQAVEALCEKKIRGYELGVKGLLLQILFLLIQEYPERPKRDSENTERLKRVLYKVETEYMNPLSIAEMAKTIDCSESHFMKWFKMMTGISFGSYLNDRRLAVAAEMLKETDEKILVIAENVGFENLSNFNRQFKKRYGTTPRQYRSV